MPKGLKSKINFNKKLKAINTNYLAPFANELKADMVTRTQSGKDRNSRAFKSYSKEYKEAKSKDFGSSKVNLTRTGQMLNGIDWKKINEGIRFYFNSSEQNTKAFYNQKTRKFFGFGAKETKELKAKLTKIYTKILKP